MKDPMEVLRMKEQELLRVRKEVEALRVVAQLLREDGAPAAEFRPETSKLVEMP
jgi:hypothetical protein